MQRKSIADVKNLVATKRGKKQVDQIAWLHSRQFDPNQNVPEPPALISIQNNKILTHGNYITISGKPKAGKSAFISALLAGATTGDPCLGWQVTLDKNKPGVVHLDTEQGDYEYYQSLQMVKKIGGIDTLPGFFQSYRLRGCKAEQIREALQHLADLPGTGLMVVDGLLDTIVDFNDIHECRMITDILRDVTEKKKIGIVCVIHQSKSTNYTIGHLGSFADRYSQSVLEVVRDTDAQISTLKGVYLRSAGFIEPVNIQYDLNNHVWKYDVHTPEHHKAKPGDYTDQDIESFFDYLFSNGRSYVLYKQIQDDAKSKLKASTKKVSSIIGRMMEMGLLTKDGDSYKPIKPPF